MTRYTGQLDLIANTVAVGHDLDRYITLLKRDGTMVLVGAPGTPHPSPQVFNLLMRRRSIAGSGIGGIKETQEMLDFCAEHDVMPEIEMTSIQDINQAWERVVSSDVKYRLTDPLFTPQIFVAADAGRDGNDVLRAEHLCGHALIFDRPRFAHRFFRETGRGEELDRETVNQQVLAFDPPAMLLEMRIDRGNAGRQPFLGGDENDVGVVCGERFYVIDRGERPPSA